MSTTKAGLQQGVRTEERSVSSVLWITLLLIVGFLIRLLFMGNEGFKNDVDSFEAWSLTLLALEAWEAHFALVVAGGLELEAPEVVGICAI